MSLSRFLLTLKGGMGSGNWGHSSKPGHYGGSIPGAGLSRLGLSRRATLVARRTAAQDVKLEKSRKIGGFTEDGTYLPSAETTEVMRRFDAALKEKEDEWRQLIIDYSKAEKSVEVAANQLNKVMDKDEVSYEKALKKYEDSMNNVAKTSKAMDEFKEADFGALTTGSILPKDRGNIRFPPQLTTIEDLMLGRNTVNTMVTKSITNGETVNVQRRTGRAYYDLNSSTIVMENLKQYRTFVHETGHFIEHKNPRVGQLANQFLENRTEGESLKPLAKVTNNPNYRKDELTRPDRFPDAYVGKYYQRGNNPYPPTEITSMGLEMMYNNPRQFYKDDREYFGLMVDIMNGRIP